MSGANASPTGRSHQLMSGANASPTGRSHQEMKRIAVVGSTGSIGQNTLRVVEHLSDRFAIFALAANSDVNRLAEQTAAFRPQVVAIMDARRTDEFKRRCTELRVAVPEVVTGESGLR